MATRCFGRAFFAGADALPLLFSLRRAVDLAAALRGDFFCAADFVAARAAGFLVFLLAIVLSPSFGEHSLSRMRFRRMGKAKRAHCHDRQARVGTLRFAHPTDSFDAATSMQPEHAVDGA